MDEAPLDVLEVMPEEELTPDEVMPLDVMPLEVIPEDVRPPEEDEDEPVLVDEEDVLDV